MKLIHPDDVVPSPRVLEHKSALITLDVETDFGSRQCTALSRLDKVLDLMAELDIPLTAFVEGRFFESRRDVCALLVARGVDVQLHCYDHGTPGDTPELLRRSVAAYTDFCGRHPQGYRAHTYRLNMPVYRALIENGFRWDSSILPAFALGGNLHRRFRAGDYLIFEDGLVEFPVATWKGLPWPLTHPYRLLVKPAGEALLRGLFGPRNLVIYNMHMVDLIRCTSLRVDHVPVLLNLLYHYAWGTNKKDTFASLRSIVRYLDELGYKFLTASELYRSVDPAAAAMSPASTNAKKAGHATSG